VQFVLSDGLSQGAHVPLTHSPARPPTVHAVSVPAQALVADVVEVVPVLPLVSVVLLV
jgi:hypothetical protein